MDFLRMEGEANYLELLPLEHRREIYEHWYRYTSEYVCEYIFGRSVTQCTKYTNRLIWSRRGFWTSIV